MIKRFSTTTFTLHGVEFIVDYTAVGYMYPPTLENPAEYPDIQDEVLWIGMAKVTGLLKIPDIDDACMEAIWKHEEERQ